ncbi:DUF4391 domain-containing protein [Dethiothermospora halolimnae]|uniref:DUF4391 domain-containing protein n=1 Tax=Dethiothermospora halolimnae TaxID=3114390 RepID=UPI003CCB7BF6
MNILYKAMDIPKSCEVGNTIFKKLFYENSSMNTRDKEIFKDCIDKIIWRYSFKEDTINIQTYKDDIREYDEIAIIEVILEKDSKCKRIAEIIQGTIPYPIILVFSYKDSFLINVGHKRTNKVDESKNTVEELIFTDWIKTNKLQYRDKVFTKSIDISKLSYANFYKFYSDFINAINLYNASIYQNDLKALENKDADEVKEITDSIEGIKKKIDKLKSKIKKERQISKTIDLNIKIKKLEKQRDKLISKLNK